MTAIQFDGTNAEECVVISFGSPDGALVNLLGKRPPGDWFVRGYGRMDDAKFKKEFEPVEPVPVPSEWVSVETMLPEPGKKDAHGVEVLIWPRDLGEPGAQFGATAFYGRRATNEPYFYKYGVVVHGVTHWRELPPAPVVQRGEESR